MINENKIRQIYKSNREQGFQLLVECFQEPIYYYIRRLVVLHEDAEDVLQEVFRCTGIGSNSVARVH